LLFWLSQEFLTKSLEISTRSSDSISIVFFVCSLRADWKNFPQKLDEGKDFMVFQIKNNQLTKNIVSGAAAIAVLAGVGIAAAPAQAAIIGAIEFDGELDLSDPGGVAPPATTTFTNFGNFVDVETTGIFTGYAPVSVGNLELTNTEGNLYALSDAPEPWKIYENSAGDQITFTFTDTPVWTRALDALGAVEYVNIGGTPSGYEGFYTLPDGSTADGAGFLNLSRSADGTTLRAEFEITQEAARGVPEPASILGLLAVGGLGLGLKRKKQS
jgi:hypothetical protein